MKDALVWAWWGFLVVAGVFNFAFLYKMAQRVPSDDPAVAKYQRCMKYLAFPFVSECAFRGVFPNVYTSRVVLWDNPLSSILLSRTFAAIGETCWMAQIGLATAVLNHQLGTPSLMLYVVPFVAVIFVVAAETNSFICTATKDNIYCTVEPCLWMSSFALLLPCAARIWHSAGALSKESRRSARAFSGVLFLYALFYCPYEWLVDIPKCE